MSRLLKAIRQAILLCMPLIKRLLFSHATQTRKQLENGEIKMIDYRLLELTEDNEGYRQFSYQCTANKNTIGIGFNLDDVGLSLEESRVILRMRMEQIEEALFNELNWLHQSGDVRRAALCDMAYQLGIKGLLKFKRSLALMESCDYEGAASEFLNSRWAVQTPKRAAKISRMIETGEYQ